MEEETDCKTKFVVGWTGMPIEMAFAGFEGVGYRMGRTDTLPLEELEEATVAGVDTVVFMGTYLTRAAMEEACSFCISAGKKVVNVVFEKLGDGSAPAKFESIPGLDIISLFAETKAGEEKVVATVPFDWARFGRTYECLLRRSGVWHNPGECMNPEYKYRGMLFMAKSECHPSMTKWCAQFKEDPLDDPETKTTLMSHGIAIVSTEDAAAKLVAKEHGVKVVVDGRPAWLVLGPWTPVRPFTEWAARQAWKRGCYIGLNMRVSPATKTVSFSAMAHSCGCEERSDVDLSFMYRAPFNGNGPPHEPGATVGVLIKIPEEGDDITALLTQALEEKTAKSETEVESE